MSRTGARRRALSGAQMLLALTTAATAVLSATVSLPAMSSAVTASQRTHAQAAAVRQQITDAERVKADPKGAQSLRALRSAIPTGARPEQALVDLRAAVREAGAGWVSSTTAPPITTALDTPAGTRNVETHTVTVAVRGSRAQVAALLARIDALPRMANVDSLVLAPGGGADATVTVRMFTLTDAKDQP